MNFKQPKKLKKLALNGILGSCLLLSARANAQDSTLFKGQVLDSMQQPIANASILLKGSKKVTYSNDSGYFNIKSLVGNTLIISIVGYDTKDYIIPSGKNNLPIVMSKLPSSLDEVIVVGYGTQKKSDITTSVVAIKKENFVKGLVRDAGQLIAGKAPGVTVNSSNGDPTSGSSISLRGINTVTGANASPLVIIDGIPGDLGTVAPENIESIDVLKDGSAAAIYGVRGTNGVVLVTTKQYSNREMNKVEYSGSESVQQIYKRPQVLTAQDYRNQIADGIRTANYDLGSSTDWVKAISNSFPISSVHNLSLTGGNSKTNYVANLNYRYLNGIFQKSNNQTLRGQVSINHSMFDNKVKINFTMMLNRNSFIQTTDGGSFSGYTYRQALIMNPTAPIKEPDGKYYEEIGNLNYQNPVAMLYTTDGRTTNSLARYQGTISYNPINNLTIKALGAYTTNNNNAGYAEDKQNISNRRNGLNGYAAVGNSSSVDRNLEINGEYKFKVQDHSFSLLGGYSYQDNSTISSFIRNYDFPTDIFSYNQIALGQAQLRGLGTIYSGKTETNIIGFVSRLTYNYQNKYLLTASVRREAASQLYLAKHPWGTFPSVSVGWHLTNEPFMKSQKIFDDIKLRAGYGITGNAPSAGFLAASLLGYSSYVYTDGSWLPTLIPSQNPNPDLKWEEKHETNLGVDYSLLNGLITGSFDYYVRNVKNLLYNYTVPSPPNLYSSMIANVGTMQNKGFEVGLNITPIKNDNFAWSNGINFSTNSNKLKTLHNDTYTLTTNYFTTGGTGEPLQTFTHIVQEGEKIGNFYGYKVVDVDDQGKWIYQEPDGTRVNYDDFNHNFNDKQVIGNGIPKYYLNVNENIRYKNWNLGITMRGAFGFQVMNMLRMYYENPGITNYNRLKSAYDKVFGKAVLNSNMPLEFNSYYIENGNYWKIDNINLGYNFSNLKSNWIKSLNVYLATNNTFIITKYKGLDPEVPVGGLTPGIDDRDKYPTARTFTVGFNASF